MIGFYLVCFSLYLVFSRQPDYFDGEQAPGQIALLRDSTTGQLAYVAVFQVGNTVYRVPAEYPFRDYRAGDKVKVIYESAQPAKGAVYHWWGYWITWEECLFSLVLLAAGYYIALAVTGNPAAVQDAEEEKTLVKKRKYT